MWLPPPCTSSNSVTKWYERQLIDWPANGPGSGPLVVCVSATTGSPLGNGWFTPTIFAAKNSANLVSKKSASPMESAAGVESDSVGASGALPETPQPMATTTNARPISANDV